MGWLLHSSRRGAELALDGYRRVQHAVTGRGTLLPWRITHPSAVGTHVGLTPLAVIKVRPMNTSLLYKEVDIKDRDFQAVIREIAAAWGIEEGQIVSIVKGGDTSFESDTDSWRLRDGDMLEFEADGVVFSGGENGVDFGENEDSVPGVAPSVHSLRIAEDSMV